MKTAIRIIAAAALASLCLCASAGASVVTFEIPGATGVLVTGMNGKGQVTGYYEDASFATHGFLWRRHGGVVTFDVPGAPDTYPSGISATGVIVGRYTIAKNRSGGFVRARNGTITTFLGPNDHAIEPLGVNSGGWSVGDTGQHKIQAFIRDPSGALIQFSAPAASAGTVAVAVNASQTVAGNAFFQRSATAVFVRAANGGIFEFGGVGTPTVAAGINDAGTITGSVTTGQQHEGFVRTVDGTFTTFLAADGAVDTVAHAINNPGTIVGEFRDASHVRHGFLRAADGTFTAFDPAGSAGTAITAINDKGAIAGNYLNADGVSLGFAGTP